MTPAALRTYQILTSLAAPAAVLRKVIIRSDGRCDFSKLTDPEFDDLAREVRRRWPGYSYLEIEDEPADSPSRTTRIGSAPKKGGSFRG